jgi:hypothetical protein
MKTGAWHSANVLDKNVYHDNTKCTDGARIKLQDRKPGSVGRLKCPRCTELNSVPARLQPR